MSDSIRPFFVSWRERERQIQRAGLQYIVVVEDFVDRCVHKYIHTNLLLTFFLIVSRHMCDLGFSAPSRLGGSSMRATRARWYYYCCTACAKLNFLRRVWSWIIVFCTARSFVFSPFPIVIRREEGVRSNLDTAAVFCSRKSFFFERTPGHALLHRDAVEKKLLTRYLRSTVKQ